MSVLAGTDDGVFRSQSEEFDDIEIVLDSGSTYSVVQLGTHGSFVASKTGLYRSEDAGTTWTRLDVPRAEVYSVAASPDGSRLYAGTHPAHLYVSTDGGRTWTDSMGFRTLPSRERWHTPRHRGSSHVRSLGVHPAVPDRVIAGVEVGGVHVSDDFGKTWTERRGDLRYARQDDLQYDVHHLLVTSAEKYFASCGGGLYRTWDAGRSWDRLKVDPDRPYHQATLCHRGMVYAAAQSLPPTLPMGGDEADRTVNGALFESTDNGETFERTAYPGEPSEFVYAWVVADGRVLAGTTKGRVIARESEGWTTRGWMPGWITSLESL